MNIFKINSTVIMIVVALIQTVVMVQAVGAPKEPSQTLQAYRNKISQISYSLGSDDQRAITFLCQNDPICMYIPLTFEDSEDVSLKKTYFLPRTKCSDFQMRYFYEDLHDSLKSIGIDLQINDVKDYNYGLSMSFTMESADAYDIVKVVDRDKKMVRFDIVAKI